MKGNSCLLSLIGFKFPTHFSSCKVKKSVTPEKYEDRAEDKKLIMSKNADKDVLSLSALYSALHVHCQSFNATENQLLYYI